MKEDKSIDKKSDNLEPDIEELDFVDTDEDGEEINLNTKLRKLRDQLKTSQTERNEYLAGWQRAKADYINLKNTEEKNRSEIIKFSKEGLLVDLIPLADSFDMAFANKEAWEQAPENWRKGIEYIYNQLMNIFKDNDLLELTPDKNTPFDPKYHESIGVIDSPEEDDGKILEVVKKGYIMQEKVIRPAQVKIGHIK